MLIALKLQLYLLIFILFILSCHFLSFPILPTVRYEWLSIDIVTILKYNYHFLPLGLKICYRLRIMCLDCSALMWCIDLNVPDAITCRLVTQANIYLFECVSIYLLIKIIISLNIFKSSVVCKEACTSRPRTPVVSCHRHTCGI